MNTLQQPPSGTAPIAIRWNVPYLREHCARCGFSTNHNTRWHDLYGPDKEAGGGNHDS
jgi:hypothetical protein